MGKRIIWVISIVSLFLILYYIFATKNGTKTIPEYLSSFVPDKYLKKPNIPDWQNSYLFLQFVSPDNSDSVRLLKNVLDNWVSSQLLIIILIDDPNKLKSRINIPYLKNTYYIDYDSSKKPAEILSKLGAYFIYDNHNRLFKSGTSSQGYEDYVKIHLMALLKNDRFLISDFAPNDKNILDFPHLKMLADTISVSNKRYFLVALFNQLCSSCKTGMLIQYLNNVNNDKDKSSIEIFAILNSNYNNENDKETLMSQSQVTFPIYLSDDRLSQYWISYISRYNRLLLNDIVMLISQSGQIIRVLDYTCDCDASFFNKVQEIR